MAKQKKYVLTPAQERKQKDGKKKVSVKQRLQALRYLPRFFTMIWETNPGMALGNAALRLVKSLLPVIMLYVGKLIIDEIIMLAAAPAASRDLQWLYTLIGIELAMAVVSDLLNRGIGLLDSLLGDLFANRTSVLIMQHAASLDLEQFENPVFYDKLERARRQTASRTALMSQVLSMVQDLITIGSLAVGLIIYYPWLIVLLIIAVIPAFLGENYFNERNYSLIFSWTPERRELDYLRYSGASDQTAKEVKSFGLNNFLTQRFKALSDGFYLANRKLAIRRSIWGSLFALLGTAGYYTAYVFIVVQTVGGAITLGTLTFLAGSFGRLKGLLESLLNRFSRMADSALYLSDYFDFFDLKPNIVKPEAYLPFPEKITTGFEFQNVSFKYPNAEKYVIQDVSFVLHPAEKLALVGENGAGKTTLVKLLARLYDPTEGQILLEGQDLKRYDPAQLRQEIGIIFQDYVRFQFTAAENIAVGRIEAQEDQTRIEDAAHRSLADKVIEKLPEKYAQRVGRRFDNGVELSGGEWQKIALGRAYMRDAQLLILDEPTAALDARSEHEVFVRFAELTKGKMAVLISHRFSTVRMADRILVLENGRLLEAGSHQELLAAGGKYAELFSLQAEGYR